jgi:hypothetical protein
VREKERVLSLGYPHGNTTREKELKEKQEKKSSST